MTNFEKILLPLVVKNISKEDICPESGFIDTYTVDVDRPSWQNEFFIVYNDFIRSEKSINRARKFENSGNLKRVYVKCINNKPCIVYSFWIDRTLKRLYDGVFILNAKQKFKVAQFWGASDEIFDIVLGSTVQSTVEHKMPLADYQKSIGEKLKGITRQCYSLFLFFIIVEKVFDRIWNLFFIQLQLLQFLLLQILLLQFQHPRIQAILFAIYVFQILKILYFYRFHLQMYQHQTC